LPLFALSRTSPRPSHYYFEVVECFRRLSLASAIGVIGNADTPYAPVCGLLLCFTFIYVFVDQRPFREDDDNALASLLQYSLTLFFLAALMIKSDAVSDSDEDQALFGYVLMAIISAGPLYIFWNTFGDSISKYLAANVCCWCCGPRKKTAKQLAKMASCCAFWRAALLLYVFVLFNKKGR
jgi:hypothetical protein